MGKVRGIILSLFFLSGKFLNAETNAIAVDPAEIEKDLNTVGITGTIHGANVNTGLFVFTWRDPKNFFRFVHLPLTSTQPQILAVLKTLDRHDKVKVVGEFLPNHAPKKHIDVTSLAILERGQKEIPHSIGIPFPNELYQMNEVTALVHIVEADGAALVIEYKDSIMPVYVTNPELTKNLYRNDKIHFKYKVRSYPKRPSHLELDSSAKDPLTIVERLVEKHGLQTTLEGTFVRFPKSDQVAFDVYALQIADQNNLRTNYTLVNFDDNNIFKAIREKLAKVWEANKATAVDGRNKWILPNIKIRATGKINVVDPGQANPQILLEGPDSIHVFKEVWEPIEAP